MAVHSLNLPSRGNRISYALRHQGRLISPQIRVAAQIVVVLTELVSAEWR